MALHYRKKVMQPSVQENCTKLFNLCARRCSTRLVYLGTRWSQRGALTWNPHGIQECLMVRAHTLCHGAPWQGQPKCCTGLSVNTKSKRMSKQHAARTRAQKRDATDTTRRPTTDGRPPQRIHAASLFNKGNTNVATTRETGENRGLGFNVCLGTLPAINQSILPNGALTFCLLPLTCSMSSSHQNIARNFP